MPIKSNISDPKCKKVYITTFGCQMNVHDTDRMKRLLLANSFQIAESEMEADAIILNTCSIREKAEKKVLSMIGRIKKFREAKKDLVIGISGCMAQRLGEKLLDDKSGINLVFGTHVIPSVPYLLKRAFLGERVLDVSEKGIDEFEFVELAKTDGLYKENVTANVTIMNGCNNYCSYCIVPYVRGPEVSRDPKEILEEIRVLVGKGVKEITLLGQNVNSYGKNSPFKMSFPELLEKIEMTEGLKRIRFVTSHPKDLSDRLINLFGSLSKLCEHIHLPVQSGSDKILKKMNRVYTSSDYRGLINKLRKGSPHIAITTDIIVAYPGEDEGDFMDTYELVKNVEFDGAFSFKYSKRPGTKASELDDTVEESIAMERLYKLQDLLKEITFKKNKEVVGKTQEILVEGESKKGDGEYFGRTRSNKIVNFKGDCGNLGGFLDLKIVLAKKNSLYGEIFRGTV